MSQQIIFYYYGVDKKTGNKKKFIFCFNHAVQFANQNEVKLETEIIDDIDYFPCNECYRDK